MLNALWKKDTIWLAIALGTVCGIWGVVLYMTDLCGPSFLSFGGSKLWALLAAIVSWITFFALNYSYPKYRNRAMSLGASYWLFVSYLFRGGASIPLFLLSFLLSTIFSGLVLIRYRTTTFHAKLHLPTN